MLSPDRFFGPDPEQKRIAHRLYDSVAGLPLLCPHGHVDPALFANEHATFGSPVDLLIIPDHYLLRMLYSQGISMEEMGVPRLDGGPVERDHRKIWRTFASHFYLFRATPSGTWLSHQLQGVFGIQEKLTADTSVPIYDVIEGCLSQPAFRPRALYEKFGIQVLCTTDAATDTLQHHQAIRASGWKGRILPTFRPDGLTNLRHPGWMRNLEALARACGMDIPSYREFIRALENRRAFFKSMGATATDHGVVTPLAEELSAEEAERIFQRALRGLATDEDAARFTAHMLMEMARMSIEDGLVMQLHCGAHRDHNSAIYDRFGPDKGGDIPVTVEFTRNLKALLNRFGNDWRLTLILFTLDESAYTRELAPLAGHYPALRLGPPWWFHDSINGMIRFREQTTETAGLYNTAGFNDDTRAFPSIPARHDLARRIDANWLAGLVVHGVIDIEDAIEMMSECAYGLAKGAYKL